MNILRRKKTPPTSSSPLAQEEDGFEARPSRRASDDIKADGSIWQETLAVCELGGELTIRSYYTNLGSAEREWDEPPSGASQILHATDEMRRMAQAQLEEMQVICATEPTEEQPKKKKGLLRGFAKNKSDKKKESLSSGKIQYKKNSFMHGDKQRDEVMDPHVQAAIALSMADQTISGTTTPDEEDDLAMATALSLSQRQEEEESKMDVLQWEVSPPQLYADRKTFQDDTSFNVSTAVESSQPCGGLKTWPPPDHHEQQESAPAPAAAATLKTWPPPKASGVV